MAFLGATVLADALPGVKHVARRGGGDAGGPSKRQISVAGFRR